MLKRTGQSPKGGHRADFITSQCCSSCLCSPSRPMRPLGGGGMALQGFVAHGDCHGHRAEKDGWELKDSAELLWSRQEWGWGWCGGGYTSHGRLVWKTSQGWQDPVQHNFHPFSELPAKSLLPYLTFLSLALMALWQGPTHLSHLIVPSFSWLHPFLHICSLSCPNSEFHSSSCNALPSALYPLPMLVHILLSELVANWTTWVGALLHLVCAHWMAPVYILSSQSGGSKTHVSCVLPQS